MLNNAMYFQNCDKVVLDTASFEIMQDNLGLGDHKGIKQPKKDFITINGVEY